MKVKPVSSYQHPDGYTVFVMPERAPRKCELWRSNKFSVANMGAKAVVLEKQGLNKRKHG